MNYIQAYSRIRNFNIQRNGEKLFQSFDQKSSEDFLNQVYSFLNLNYPKFHKMDVLSRAGLTASELISGHWKNQYSNEEVAVVLSNSNSSLETDSKFATTLKTYPSPSLFVYTLPNIVIGEICIRNGWKGENAFFVSEGFDPALLKDYVDMVLENPSTSACLAGWIEVSENQQDVFLYLTDKNRQPASIDHTKEQILNLYYGNF